MTPSATSRQPFYLSLAGLLLLLVSGYAPHDRLTWFLEICPILVIYPVLFFTRRKFPLTPLAYWLIFFHALVLMLGGRYTYAEVPVGDWVKNALHLSRNPYDRFGHLMQGFVPAILAREILLRCSPLRRGKWLLFLVTCVCLALSASYELFEWGASMVLGQDAESFLGTQGDPWDTQWDMLCALIGAALAQLTLPRWHDRQLARPR